MFAWLRAAAVSSRRLMTFAQPEQPESDELRRFEFDVRPGSGVAAGPAELKGYVLYFVCEDVRGTCLMLRQDITIKLTVTE